MENMLCCTNPQAPKYLAYLHLHHFLHQQRKNLVGNCIAWLASVLLQNCLHRRLVLNLLLLAVIMAEKNFHKTRCTIYLSWVASLYWLLFLLDGVFVVIKVILLILSLKSSSWPILFGDDKLYCCCISTWNTVYTVCQVNTTICSWMI